MANAAHAAEVAVHNPSVLDAIAHSAVVRVTHWIHTLAFFALLISGIAILIAHPRLYWGETGALGTPALIELPLPLKLGESGWGRYLHFLAAWAAVLNGSFYVVASLVDHHFRGDLVPSATDLTWSALRRVVSDHLHLRGFHDQASASYNVLQRLAYLGVIFALFPLVIITGLAMSPAITSVAPPLVTIFGGQQSARTIHFFVASFLVLFLFVHIAMVCLTGFATRMRAMIMGPRAVRQASV